MTVFNFIFDFGQYALNPYAVAPFLVATLILIFSIFLYSLDQKSPLSQVLLYFSFAAALWLYSCVLLLSTKSSQLALFWSHFLYLGFIFTPPTVFHLSVDLTRRYAVQRNYMIAFYVLAVGLIPLCQSPNFFIDIKKDFFGFYPTAGFLYPVVLSFFVLGIVVSLINLLHYHFVINDTLEKKSLKLFIFSFVVLSMAAMDIAACAPQAYLYPSGFIGFLAFIIGLTCFKLMSYANTIQRHAENLERQVELKTKELSHVLHDLRTTQLKLLETGKKSALASLSAGILHQISQPVTAIHGFTRFLKKEMKPDEPFYKPICHIEEQSVYIKRMLEDLTNLVRHREIQKENVDINVVVKRATNLLTDELRIRRVRWDLALAEGLPPVFADSVLLQQVFMNLLVSALNAFENMPRGSERALKVITRLDNAQKEVVVSFEDTAPELSDEERAVAVEPFFSTRSKASGVGVALCQDLLAEHGGRMEIEGRGGKGNIFHLRFPVADK